MSQSVEEKIKQRRLQILIHSCIYYDRDDNIISDAKWNRWAQELVSLQSKYPEEASKVIWNEAFRDFDGSSGAFLPIHDSWVQYKTNQLLRIRDNRKLTKGCKKMSTKKKSKKSTGRKLF